MNQFVVQADDFSLWYRGSEKPALRNINLKLSRGESLAVLGPAMAGKSTFCSVLSGILPQLFPSLRFEGHVEVCGMDPMLDNVNRIIPVVGVVLQNPSIQLSGIKPTVFDEVAFSLQLAGVPQTEILERVEATLVTLGVIHLRLRNPLELSGGEAKKVALACALVKEPPVLVLDEPFSNLDSEGVRDLSRTLSNVTKRGTTLIVSDVTAQNLFGFDRILVLDDGAPSAAAQTRSLIESPVEPPEWMRLVHRALLMLDHPIERMPLDYRSSVRLLRQLVRLDPRNEVTR